jgi:hypothetical protein
VLLARLQREHEGAAAVFVGGLAYDAAGILRMCFSVVHI